MLASRWIAALALLGGIVATGLACGPDLQLEDESLFDPRTGTRPDLLALLYDPNTCGFGSAYEYSDYFRAQNLEEWSGWLGGGAQTLHEWESILYRGSGSQLDSAILSLSGKGVRPRAWQSMGLWSLPVGKLRPALRYVRFAASQESISRQTSENSWWNPERPSDSGHAEPRHEDPEQEAMREKDPFLRQRWLFQAAKSHFYAQEDSLPAFLARRSKDLRGPSESLWWRSRMYLAGVLRATDTLAANLECANVAVNFPTLAQMAANDFRIREQKDWQRQLSLARSTGERCGLLFLAGLHTGDLAMAEDILALDSTSPFPQVLAVRLLARRESSPQALEPLRALSAQLSSSRRTAAPAFWNLLAGHLEGLSGQEKAALEHLDSAARLGSSDEQLLHQVKASRVVVRLTNAKAPSAELEGFLMRELPALDSAKDARWPHFDVTIRKEMARVWSATPALAQTLEGIVDPKRAAIKAQLDLRRGAGSEFIRFADRRAPVGTSGLSRNIAVIDLYAGHPRLAIAALALDTNANDLLETDPFNAEITDDHDRDRARFKDADWSLLSYAQEIAGLEDKADRKGPEAAKAALRLGIGLYNRTLFGNARRIYEGTVLDRDAKGILELEPARRRFEQAARDLPSPEGRAWATWLLAKCERDARNDGSWPSKSYARLRKQCAKTRFWKSALKECGWLQAWNREEESPRPE